MYEVNLHVTPLGQNVTVFLWRKVRGCSLVGMLVLENLHYTKASDSETDACKMKKEKKKNRKKWIKGEILSSGVCWHCQETISSKSTKRCWSLGECLEWLNTRCWETCCVGQHVTSSLNLHNCAFVLSTRATVHQAVQKRNPSAGSTGLFNMWSTNSKNSFCCWQTIWIIDNFQAKQSKSLNALGEDSESSLGQAYRSSHSASERLVAWPFHHLPLQLLRGQREVQWMWTIQLWVTLQNLDNSTSTLGLVT